MAEVKEIRWSRRAVRQVESIGEHIEIDSPWQAERIVNLLFSTPEKLLWSPRKGKIVPEFSDPNLREVSVYIAVAPGIVVPSSGAGTGRLTGFCTVQ